MRLIAVLLASLVTMGCGAGSGIKASHVIIGSAIFPPTISMLSPSSVPVNSVPFTMTINGDNFGSDAVVFWNGVPQNTRLVTSKQLLVAVTNTDLAFAGLVPVFVRTGGQNSNTVDFDVTLR